MKQPTHIPATAHVHIPDEWKLVSMVNVGPFRWQASYSNGVVTKTESELLTECIACYRQRIDRFTVVDYNCVEPVK